jgi:hypothetical protein
MKEPVGSTDHSSLSQLTGKVSLSSLSTVRQHDNFHVYHFIFFCNIAIIKAQGIQLSQTGCNIPADAV